MDKRNIELSRSQIEGLIDEWILNERDRAIVKRRMCDGVPFEQLSEDVHLSVNRVKSIVYKAKDRIYRHLGGVD
jgi:DNA-directed RNA polymerase specialized sigma24 family protein